MHRARSRGFPALVLEMRQGPSVFKGAADAAFGSFRVPVSKSLIDF